MILRPRQKAFVERCVSALHEHGNTLGVAPTGAGKTIMLSGVIGELHKNGTRKACVLAHRDELTDQNNAKFLKVNPSISTSVFDAKQKSWDGDATFAMVQTLCREKSLDTMPRLDVVVIDEAHHAPADSYKRIIERAYDLNPDLKLFGVTATPNRGDKKALRSVFSNVGDQISIGELIKSGNLVKPRTFVIDIGGTQGQLRSVRKTVHDFDMREVEAIMNKSPINQAVVEHWLEHAADRKTVIFCSTLAHAKTIQETFQAAGVEAAFVHGELNTTERQNELEKFTHGSAKVICNVAVLTEGWDYPPTSCVILLRPSSYKSTMIQMVGHGLRTVDPSEFPGVYKNDCIVLDFGTSSIIHGSLEQDVDLEPFKEEGVAPSKECPECGATVPASSAECELCGFEFESALEDKDILSDFVMTEVDLFKQSSFLWVDPLDDHSALIANGFNAWAGVFFLGDTWYAVGGTQSEKPRLLSISEKLVALAAANDFLNAHESDASAHKSKRWLEQAPTEKQLAILPQKYRMDYSLTRYKASVLITFQFNRRKIRDLVFSAAQSEVA